MCTQGLRTRLGSPALQAKGTKPRSLRRGECSDFSVKREKVIVQGNGPGNSLDPSAGHQFWGVTQGNFSLLDLFPLLLVCICLEMLIAFNINIRKAN